MVFRAAIARHQAATRGTADASRPHAHGVSSVCARAPHVRLCSDRVPSTCDCACQYESVLQDNVALGRVDNGACDAMSREQSAGTAAAARELRVCLTRAAAHASRVSGPLLLIAAALSTASLFLFLVCRLLLLPALSENPTFVELQPALTARWCFATSWLILIVSTTEGVKTLLCMCMLKEATLKTAAFCCCAKPM